MERLILRSSRLYHAIQPSLGGSLFKLVEHTRLAGPHPRLHHLQIGQAETMAQKYHTRYQTQTKRAQVLARNPRAMTLMVRPSLQITRINLGGSISGERDCGEESPHQCRGTSVELRAWRLDSTKLFRAYRI